MKVSIITVSFNSAETILDTFDCIRKQTIQNLEYILVDGGSTDGTLDIINQSKDIITTAITEPDQGIYDAMNKGIINSTGEIIGILNSDDVYFSDNTLALVQTAFLQHNCDIVYGNIHYVSKDLNKIIRKWISNSFSKGSFKHGWHPPHPAFFVRKSVYDQCGLYDLKFNIAADFDFMLRSMESNNFKIHFINETITKMRIGGESNRSIKNIIKGNKEILQSFRKNNISVNSTYYLLRRFIPKAIQLTKSVFF